MTAYGCVGIDWRERVVSDPALARPLEPGRALADPSKARRLLAWAPTVTFEQMVEGMVHAQIARMRRGPDSAGNHD